MKVILMAAGRGTRISKHIGEIPKSMVNIGNTTLIKHTVDMLHSQGVSDITIIVGYKHQLIEKEVEKLGVKIYYNPFFAVTNSIGSLWLARNELVNDDIILGNGDVFWQEDLYEMLKNDKRDVVILTDKTRVDSGDYYFNTNKNGEITAYGKELTRENRTCEYVGLVKINKNFLPIFINQLNQMIDNGEYDKWWENTLYSMIDKINIHTLDVGGKFWSEIDYWEDYTRVIEYVKNRTSK